MRAHFLFLAFVILLLACKGKQPTEEAGLLASVREHTLSRREVKQLIPARASSEDSLLLAESIVRKWVKDVLVYDMAQRNLSDEKAEIDRLVDNYRRSLVRYRYQERLVREKLSADISEADMRDYYEANRKELLLDRNLVKGLFLKIPVDAPALSDVKSWYRSTNESALEKIEKYSVQNANVYDYFYDKWVDFDDVMDNIPIHVADPKAFLRAHSFVEVADSNFCYLLNIAEYLPSGSVAPYDYAVSQIKELLVNQRKVEFLRNFEDELYNDAIRRGDVKFYTKP